MSNHTAVYLSVFVLFSLTQCSYQMPYNISDSWKRFLLFVLVCFYFWSRTTHLRIPLSPVLIPSHTPPLPFLMAVQSDPPLAQSWSITPHPNQGAGWKRWQASEGPLTRYRFEWRDVLRGLSQGVWGWGGESLDYWTTTTCLFIELDIIQDCRLLKNDGFFPHCNRLKGAILSGTLFVIFVKRHWPFFSASLSDLNKEELGTLVHFSQDQFVSI